MMHWKYWSTIGALGVALLFLTWWQHREYVQERELMADALRRQSHSVMNALVGGIRTHRRRGRFFEDQLQGSIDGLVSAPDVLAVGIADADGQLICWAGESRLLNQTPYSTSGEYWDPVAFLLVEQFSLPQVTGGFGGGGGPGRRFGANLYRDDEDMSSELFADGGDFSATLALDRSQFDAQCRRAAWLRGSVIAAGTLLLFGVSLAWYVTLRAAGRARLLEAEARHFRDLSQAAAGLAHETRNPLGLIRGWAQRLVQTGFDSPEQQRQAESIVEECDRVTARINQFLAFARPPRPTLQSVRLNDLLDELAMILEPDLEAHQIKIGRDSSMLEITVQADRELLRQALFNLLQNALQASPSGSVVDVAIRSGQDGRKRIEVANRGDSVAAEIVESLFTPYFTTRPGGTGLGLAIVRHISRAHGWQAGYSPRSGGGSVFWLDGIQGG
jgi:signal transduction histidine kinase